MDPATFQFLLVVSCVIDVITALAVIFLLPLPRLRKEDDESPRVLRTRRIVLAVMLAGVVFVLKSLAAHSIGVNRFGQIHLLYNALAFSAPLAAWITLLIATSLTRAIRINALAGCVLLFVGLVAPMVYAYATFVEPYRLQFEKHTVRVAGERAGNSPFHIGVLADIQTARVTDYEREAIRMLLDTRPDIILIPGDLFSGDSQALQDHWQDLYGLLSELEAPGGVYFCPGNCEQLYDLESYLSWQLPNITMLKNSSTHRIEVRDRVITIAGVELDCESALARSMIEQLNTGVSEDDIRILMSHRPDAVLQLPTNADGGCRVDLVVAGHTHGGQVVVPGFGPPLTLSDVPREVGAGGLHDMDGRMIYVSRGLGWEGGQAPRIRFMCPPEVTLLTLE